MSTTAPRELPERFYFSGSNCTLSAVDYGNAGKPDVVILHGMRDHALSMTSIAEALRGRYRVIVADLRGHGDSDNPGSYTMTQFVADLRALTNHRHLVRPILIGHSLGGHITSRYAAIYARETGGLVLIDGMGPPRANESMTLDLQREMWRNNIENALQLSSERRPLENIEEAMRRLTGNNPGLAQDTARLIVEHGTEPHPDGGIRWKWDPAINMVWSTFSHDESELQWGLIECPVLIVTGDESMQYWSRRNLGDTQIEGILARETTRRLGLFRDARHVVIEGAGHMVHYDQPGALNACIGSFLDDIGAGE
ncbi:MAG TPA: alpha/beta hydrolase [Pseudomonadales bacterium]|nr:alpha/beta hydrolase [Pseudomonadales bacterium]